MGRGAGPAVRLFAAELDKGLCRVGYDPAFFAEPEIVIPELLPLINRLLQIPED